MPSLPSPWEENLLVCLALPCLHSNPKRVEIGMECTLLCSSSIVFRNSYSWMWRGWAGWWGIGCGCGATMIHCRCLPSLVLLGIWSTTPCWVGCGAVRVMITTESNSKLANTTGHRRRHRHSIYSFISKYTHTNTRSLSQNHLYGGCCCWRCCCCYRIALLSLHYVSSFDLFFADEWEGRKERKQETTSSLTCHGRISS